jgi:uncharacterized integral membrane protein
LCIGKSTKVSNFCLFERLKENLFKWITKTSGSLHRSSFLLACLCSLHLGQYLSSMIKYVYQLLMTIQNIVIRSSHYHKITAAATLFSKEKIIPKLLRSFASSKIFYKNPFCFNRKEMLQDHDWPSTKHCQSIAD